MIKQLEFKNRIKREVSLLWTDLNIRKNDPKKRTESKIQRCVRKLKSKITKEKGSKLHPTGSMENFMELQRIYSKI